MPKKTIASGTRKVPNTVLKGSTRPADTYPIKKLSLGKKGGQK